MNQLQINLDFSTPVIHRENNKESEKIFIQQEERLRGNRKILYEALLRGEKLTGMDCMRKYNMTEYRKRFQELKKIHKVPVKDEILSNGAKVWYLYLINK